MTLLGVYETFKEQTFLKSSNFFIQDRKHHINFKNENTVLNLFGTSIKNESSFAGLNFPDIYLFHFSLHRSTVTERKKGINKN